MLGFSPEFRFRSEDRGFVLALAWSVLLHFIFIIVWKAPLHERSAAGHQVLSVSFKVAMPAPKVSAPQPIEQYVEPRIVSKVLVREQPSDKSLKAAVQPLPQQRVLPAAPVQQKATPNIKPLPVQTGQPVPGIPQQIAPRAGGVSVRLQIGDGGNVEQIIWDRLPALTEEQFRRVEAAIRSRKYSVKKVGGVVSEIIDVRLYLNLPAERQVAPELTPSPDG